MTTIAYRDGMLAADSAMTAGELYRGRRRKVHWSLGPGGRTLVAACGSSGVTALFVRWAMDGSPDESKPVPHEKDSLLGVVIRPDGAIEIWNERMQKQTVEAPFVAAGSGNELAMGAMAMGASAVEAVRVACRFDIYSAEPVDSVSLRD